MVTFHIIAILIMIEFVSTFTTDETAIDWKQCGDSGLEKIDAEDVECGFLSVPLDYTRPKGSTIQIAISRIKHKVSADKFQGVILINPGGPGSSGLSLVTIGSAFSKTVSDAYDWIGFDPRGVGSSKPALYCMPTYHDGPTPDYIPRNKQLENFWLMRSESYVRACIKNNSKLLSYMTTIDVVKDMESLRVALLQDQINFYGLSYGTYLGQVYATLFPNRVRRMILDSSVDPRSVWYKLNIDQCSGLDYNLKMWFRWLAKYNNNFQLGETENQVAEKWNDVVKELAINPADGTVGPLEWINVFTPVTYSQLPWTLFGVIFSRWVNQKDFSGLFLFHKMPNKVLVDNKYAVYLSVMCADAKWPQNWKNIRIENWLTFKKAPIFTWYNAWHNAPCQYWPQKANKPVHINGSNIGDILLIIGTLDAPTPFEGSLEVRRRFPRARLIAKPGGMAHALKPGLNQCVTTWIAKYLESGDLPTRKSHNGPDAICPPLPEPNPEIDEQHMQDEIDDVLHERFYQF
ncbi:unnamed protein product [Rotaria sp. Silwood1]|nr:unnamed protein product [Rotaria sp. Silwood1]